MKVLSPLLVIYSLWAMVCFTDPEGFAVWIQKDQIVSVSHPRDCVAVANTKISTGNGTFVCVRETLSQALARIDAAQ